MSEEEKRVVLNASELITESLPCQVVAGKGMVRITTTLVLPVNGVVFADVWVKA
jgi:hypothetical protein